MFGETDLEPLWSVFGDIIADGASYVQDEATTRESFRQYWLGRGGEQWVAASVDGVVGRAGIPRDPVQLRGQHQ